MIVAGFGFRGSATHASLRAAYDMALSGRIVDALATAQDKAQAGCFTALAAELGLPALGVAATDLHAVRTTTQSPRALQERATGSLAEAAALAAAGTGARLLSPRHISPDGKATCALAIGDAP